MEIPSEKGKITTKPKGNAVYVNYELSREYNRIDENPNYMTVPAAIRELEKIEMVRGQNGTWS